MGYFCSKYNEVVFLCNVTDRHKIRSKMSIGVLYSTLTEEFRIFPFHSGADFAPNPPFEGCFDGSPCYRPTGQGLRFST